jgi:hypothetical protein
MGFMPRAEKPARKTKGDVKQKTNINQASELGAQLDHLYAFDQKIDAMEAELRMTKQIRATAERQLMESMLDSKVEGCLGKRASARLKHTRHPTIKDRGALDKYILKTKNIHLLQNRVVSSVYFEMLEEGNKVPGVEIFDKVSLSITKRRK